MSLATSGWYLAHSTKPSASASSVYGLPGVALELGNVQWILMKPGMSGCGQGTTRLRKFAIGSASTFSYDGFTFAAFSKSSAKLVAPSDDGSPLPFPARRSSTATDVSAWPSSPRSCTSSTGLFGFLASHSSKLSICSTSCPAAYARSYSST